jgi:integrase/recombinase XerC
MNQSVKRLLLPLILPVTLDGYAGSNHRLDANRLVSADADIEAIRLWLAEYTLSPNTLRNYRKEAIRLIVWSMLALGKPLSNLTREDFQRYERFLAAPNANWPSAVRRLFHGPLSPRSRQQSLHVLSSMLNSLVRAGHLSSNPLVLRIVRAEPTLLGQRVKCNIDYSLWKFVLDSIEAWPKVTMRERQRYERSRWTMRLMYHTALRISEIANAQSCDFRVRDEHWWLRVKCKGGLEGEVLVSDTLMSEFARYRSFHGLSPVRFAYDTTPVVMSISGDTERHITPAAVYLIVKEAFHRASAALESIDPVGAKTLSDATTHCLRQSAISHRSGTSRRAA